MAKILTYVLGVALGLAAVYVITILILSRLFGEDVYDDKCFIPNDDDEDDDLDFGSDYSYEAIYGNLNVEGRFNKTGMDIDYEDGVDAPEPSDCDCEEESFEDEFDFDFKKK